ncbi:hypothetical protein KAJ26_04235 [bacterium]|nr:hypothetical protein [bacterium]
MKTRNKLTKDNILNAYFLSSALLVTCILLFSSCAHFQPAPYKGKCFAISPVENNTDIGLSRDHTEAITKELLSRGYSIIEPSFVAGSTEGHNEEILRKNGADLFIRISVKDFFFEQIGGKDNAMIRARLIITCTLINLNEEKEVSSKEFAIEFSRLIVFTQFPYYISLTPFKEYLFNRMLTQGIDMFLDDLDSFLRQ